MECPTIMYVHGLLYRKKNASWGQCVMLINVNQHLGNAEEEEGVREVE